MWGRLASSVCNTCRLCCCHKEVKTADFLYPFAISVYVATKTSRFTFWGNSLSVRNTDVLSWSHLASSLDAASSSSDVAAGPVGGGGVGESQIH